MNLIRTNVAVALLLNPYREVLLQKKDLRYHWKPGKWGFFGGRIDENLGETPEQALRRELTEELGMKFEELQHFRDFSFHETSDERDLMRSGKLYVYHGNYQGKLSDIRLDEGAGFAFFGEREISTLDMVSYNKMILNEFYESLPRKE